MGSVQEFSLVASSIGMSATSYSYVQVKTFTGGGGQDDGDAFALFYQRHHPDVWNMSFFYLKDHHEAEDAAQETFLKAWRGRARCRAGGSGHAWLLAICRNVCIDRLRGRPKSDVLDSLDEGGRHEISDPRSAPPDEDRRIDLRRALANLAADEREAWFLVDVLGFRSQEAAKIVRAPAASTMRSRVARARQALAAELREQPLETLAGLRPSDVYGVYHTLRGNAIVVSIADPVAQRVATDPARCMQMQTRAATEHAEASVLRQSYLRLCARLEAPAGDGSTPDGLRCPDLFEFLERLERDMPRDRRVLALVETAPSHDSRHTDRWRAAHPRWRLHGTACHRAWQQAVEELFAGHVTNGDNHGARRMLALIDAADPFVWTDSKNGHHP